MKFIVESVTKCGRLGLITEIDRLADKAYKTPLLLFTEHNLSREVLGCSNLLDNLAILLPFDQIEQMLNPLKAFKQGISEFIGLKDCLTFVTVKKPSVNTPSGHHEKGLISIFNKSGRKAIGVADYMAFIDVACSDFYVTLADGDTWLDCSKKRTIKAVINSAEMFDQSIIYHKSELKCKSKLIATIEGGYNVHERNKCIEHIRQFDENIFGYFIDGLHRNGTEAITVNREKVSEIVASTLSNLPENKIKIMLGAYSPVQMLDLVSLGVDVYDSSFAIIVSRMNRALTFNFDVQNPLLMNPEIDLMNSMYKEDFSPFLENCECLACKQHTKSYTNHLLITKELLGPMLLTIHNLHHYRNFFEAIRNAIKDDKLKDLTQLIENQYKNFNYSYEIPPSSEIPKNNQQNSPLDDKID